MITLKYRVQLVVFAVIGLLALTVVSILYVHLPQELGFGQYSVTADFATVDGLYPNALVTYRGVDVGQVSSLDLTDDGVMVRMRINNGTKIATNAVASIHSTSAIGEQYLDLVPARDNGPYLHSGTVIDRSHTRQMPQTAPLLDGLEALLTSLPKDKLSDLLTNLDTTFKGTGTQLHTLIAQSSMFVSEAVANVGPTTSLLRELAPFLATQQAIGAQIGGSVHDLASFTGELAMNNHELQKFLADSAPFANQFSGFVDTVNPTLPVLLTNLVTTSAAVEVYLPNLEQTLVLLPPDVAGDQDADLPYLKTGKVLLDFKLDVNTPTACTTGFLPKTQWRDPRVVTTTATPGNLYCKVPSDSPVNVRGARNFPCTQFPGYRAATVDICSEKATGHPLRLPAPAMLPGDAPVSTAQYEPTTGRFIGPDGKFYMLGSGRSSTPATTWQQLLLSTVRK